MKKFKKFILIILFAFIGQNTVMASLMPEYSVQEVQQNDIYAWMRENFRIVMEKFCCDFYQQGFGGKIYKQGSLIVNQITPDENNFILYVNGVHSYYGKSYGFGRKEHHIVPFKATIGFVQNGIRFIFEKWYEPDIRYPNGGWEKLDRIVPMNYGSY